MLKNLLLSLLLLPVLVMAAPPPADNWLAKSFSDQHWGLRLDIKLLDIYNYVSKVTMPAMKCVKNEICGYISSTVFASFENGGMPKLEELNPLSAPDFLTPDDIDKSSPLLAKMTGKRVAQVNYDRPEDAFDFIADNIGAGDHVAVTLEISNNGKIEGHVFNAANFKGRLVAIDTAQRINGKRLLQPLDEVFRIKRIGEFKITEQSDYTINFVIRDNRTYVFPPITKGKIGGQLSEIDNGRIIHIEGVRDSRTLKAELDQLNLCPKGNLS